MLSQRIPVTEVFPGKRLADHGDGRRALPVAFVEITARQNRNLHRCEESRSDGQVPRRGVLRLSGQVDWQS